MSTCCDVPSPKFKYCNFVAPARPKGTRMPLAVSPVHQASCRRGHVFERHFDPLGLFRAAADGLHQPRELFFLGGGLSRAQRIFLDNRRSCHTKRLPFQVSVTALRSISFRSNCGGSGSLASLISSVYTPHRAPLVAILVNRRAAVSVKVHRKICDDQNPERLGHFAGEGVVFVDRFEFVAQILLNDVFHLLGQIGQTAASMWPGSVQMRLVTNCSS